MPDNQKLNAAAMEALDHVKIVIELMAGWRVELERHGYTPDEARRLAVALAIGNNGQES